MVRDFTAQPVGPQLLDRLLDTARRAPSAGHSQGVSFVVLTGRDTSRYWDVTLPEPGRAGFRWPGLVRAPVLVLLCCSPDVYVERYAEGDKASSGLGSRPDAWPVPYWWVDAGAVAQNLLLGAVDAGLGACLFGLFDHEDAVRAEFGIPAGWRTVATIALGHPGTDEPGRSARRGWRPMDEVVHRGGW